MYPYSLYEQSHAAMAPFRAWAGLSRLAVSLSPIALFAPAAARQATAGLEMFERMTRRYAKPAFGIARTAVAGEPFVVEERVEWESPFCRVVHFAKVPLSGRGSEAPAQPRLLIVAPLSGHHATLLRNTVETMLPGCDVLVTDWVDARLVPVAAGRFDLDDYIDHLRAILRSLGPGTHVMGVCQPAVAVLAATALMEAAGDPCGPASMTLMGGPIDTRISPTKVNELATSKGMAWFEGNAIATVPFPNPGAGRRVYPGYAQLAGFVAMNLDRHVDAHRSMHGELASGDAASSGRRKDFYDEYLAVLDLTEEFYLQTIRSVFVEHDLPRGAMLHRGLPVDPSAIRRCALMTVEGENDDITGLGQTEAAHALCANIPDARRVHHLQPGVGHYGTFSGRRFAAEIAPRIQAFVEASAFPPDA
jgi:poly(3-hydroxybutyrate) depolymerase